MSVTFISRWNSLVTYSHTSRERTDQCRARLPMVLGFSSPSAAEDGHTHLSSSTQLCNLPLRHSLNRLYLKFPICWNIIFVKYIKGNTTTANGLHIMSLHKKYIYISIVDTHKHALTRTHTHIYARTHVYDQRHDCFTLAIKSFYFSAIMCHCCSAHLFSLSYNF